MVAYASCSLTRQERQYCITRRELLAAVEFIQFFYKILVRIIPTQNVVWFYLNFKSLEHVSIVLRSVGISLSNEQL